MLCTFVMLIGNQVQFVVYCWILGTLRAHSLKKLTAEFSFGVLGYWYFSVDHNIWGKGGCSLKQITNLILSLGLEVYTVLYRNLYMIMVFQ